MELGVLKKEGGFLLESMKTAMRLCRLLQQEVGTGPAQKPDRSPVTVADFACQAAISGMLESAFPGDELVAEERSADMSAFGGAEGEGGEGPVLDRVSSYVSVVHPTASREDVRRWIDRGSGETKGRFWVLDPVDGTKGFLRRQQYVTAMALLQGNEVVLGALACPGLNLAPTPVLSPEHGPELAPDLDGPELAPDGPWLEPDLHGPGVVVMAASGRGTWAFPLDGRPPARLRVSSVRRPDQARMLRSVEDAHTDGPGIDRIAGFLETSMPMIRMDSQAKLALVASGRAELALRFVSPERSGYVEKIWDLAPGAILVEEAGGRVSDIAGHPLDFGRGRLMKGNTGLLASNSLLHEEALSAARRALTPDGADG